VRNSLRRVDQERDQEQEAVTDRYSRNLDHPWRPYGRTPGEGEGRTAGGGSGLRARRPRSALEFAEGRAVDPDGRALMAQAAEQGSDHVLVAEEVEPVIVVEVGRDAGPLSHHLARANRASHPTAIPNTPRISCRAVSVPCCA
jgi:hypothetical protein